MRDANSVTSGVMSSTAKSRSVLSRSRAARVSCPCFVNDKLRDVDLKGVFASFPPLLCDLLATSNYQVPAWP